MKFSHIKYESSLQNGYIVRYSNGKKHLLWCSFCKFSFNSLNNSYEIVMILLLDLDQRGHLSGGQEILKIQGIEMLK